MTPRPNPCLKRTSIALVSLIALASTSRAAEFTYGIGAGVGESDNVTLASTNKVSQTIGLLDLDFDLKQKSRLFDVDAKGDFSYLDYLEHAYGSQLIGRFDGVGDVALIPGRLTWTVRDDFGQSAVTPFTPVTPGNLENVNYFSTGPDGYLRLGGTSFLNASARYARSQYQTSPYNSNRVLGTLAVGRELSAHSTASLNVQSERVMFENTTVNTDFDRTDAYARYDLDGARTGLSAELGATRISQTNAPTTGVLAKFSITRKLSSAAQVNFAAGRFLTDASTSFSNLGIGPKGAPGGALAGNDLGGAQGTGVIGTAPAALSGESYTSNNASAGWQYARHRTTLGLTGSWEKDTYPNQPTLDLTRYQAGATVERRLTRAWTAQLHGTFVKTEYPNAAPAAPNQATNYNSGVYGGLLRWRGGRGVEVVFRYDHNSWVVSGPGSGYSENRVFLTVGYRPRLTAETSTE